MKGKTMKTNLLLPTVAVAMLTLSFTAKAGDVLRSPRDASNQPKVATPSATSDPDLLHPYTGTYAFSPKSLGNRENVAALGSQAGDRDLVRAHRTVLYTGRNPAGSLLAETLAVAPVK